MASSRKCPRTGITGQARLFDAGGDCASAQIADVGMNGASLYCEKDLIVGSEYRMELILYPDLEFNVKSQTVWMTNDNGKKMYGMEFREFSAAEKIKLQQAVMQRLLEAPIKLK